MMTIYLKVNARVLLPVITYRRERGSRGRGSIHLHEQWEHLGMVLSGQRRYHESATCTPPESIPAGPSEGKHLHLLERNGT